MVRTILPLIVLLSRLTPGWTFSLPGNRRPSSVRSRDVVEQLERKHPFPFTSLYYENDRSRTLDETSSPSASSPSPLDRFHREASKTQEIDEECIITIHGSRYNLTAWANAHPGGAGILKKFNGRDASKAFEAAHHSAEAYAMLKDFQVVQPDHGTDTPKFEKQLKATNAQQSSPAEITNHKWRARRKLFTKEDPIGVHKYLGLFCLLNFIGRYRQMYFGDPAAGLGSLGHPFFSMACLFPHALLSLSSLIFHTVPKERVVGKPMIWQEYRVHNIIFGVRSVLTALATSLVISTNHHPLARRTGVVFCGACVLAANWAADKATERLRVVSAESTTATMPYWEGCSMETQKRFKGFYAYCQFLATLACLACGNPSWPLAVLLAIQLASLLMTLVRKGLLSAKGYHYGYTATLVAPFIVGFRSFAYTRTYEFPAMLVLGYVMYQLRRRGVNKFALWVPVIIGRILVGDHFIDYAAW
jgi:cytochrome b involved in lipid metabolism